MAVASASVRAVCRLMELCRNGWYGIDAVDVGLNVILTFFEKVRVSKKPLF